MTIMLTVFHVNSGRIIEFDMSHACHTVLALKQTIESSYAIPADKQVLLISGGEILRGDAKVYSYSSGTDTNPIFMISTVPSVDGQPLPLAKFGEQRNFCDVIRAALSLPAAYSTVVARAKLAQQVYEAGNEETRMCERIVQEQHLQQQGWLAVVANMEDTSTVFNLRFHDFYAYLDANLPRMAQYQQRLDALADDLRTLDQIAISPGLMQAAVHYDFEAFGSQLQLEGSGGSLQTGAAATAAVDPSTIEELNEEEEDAMAPVADASASDQQAAEAALVVSTALVHYQSDAAASASAAGSGQLTLLQWLRLGSKNSESLEHIAEQCSHNIGRFNAVAMAHLRAEVEQVNGQAQQEGIRDLRNIGPRFQQLDKLVCDARQLMKEQRELAAAIQKHETQLSHLSEASVLPDLCDSHASQLAAMLENHNQLCDFHRRIHKSKMELCDSMGHRIKFMSQVENRMHGLDTTMMFYNQCLRRLHRHLEVVEQIRAAPGLYALAVEEVLRRRTFAAGFARWCAELVGAWSVVYNGEVGRRLEFRERFGGHFLGALFTGLEDVPPPFAIEEPAQFDANLPNVSMNDLIVLSKFMPVTMPDMSSVIEFFAGRSTNAACATCAKCTKSTGSVEFEKAEQEQQAEARQTAHPKPTDMLYHLKDGCDSETDTEEFEKLDKLATPATSTTTDTTTTCVTCATCSAAAAAATTPITRCTSTSMPELVHQTTSTSTSTADVAEDRPSASASAAAHEAELQRLRQLLCDMRHLCTTTLASLRTQLAQLSHLSATDRATLQQQFAAICRSWTQLETDRQAATAEQLAQHQATHQRALRSLQQQLNAAHTECAKLRSDAVDAAMVHTNRATEADDARRELQALVDDLQAQLAAQAALLTAADAERQRAVREAHETMQRQHKTEVESLRSRFKLMANMERSPSDSSLEKIDRAECVQAAVVQLAAATDFAAISHGGAEVVVQQQPRAAGGGATPKMIGGAVPGLAQSPGKSSVDVFRQILFAKEQELEQMRAEQLLLGGQNRSLRDAIQVLTTSSATTAVEERTVRDELAELKRELSVERNKRVEMERSFVRADHVNEEGLNSRIRKLKQQLEVHVLQAEIRLLELGNASHITSNAETPSSPACLSLPEVDSGSSTTEPRNAMSCTAGEIPQTLPSNSTQHKSTQPASPKPSALTSLITTTRTTTSTATLSTVAGTAASASATASAAKTRSSSTSAAAAAKTTLAVSQTTTTSTATVSAAGTTTVTGTPGRSRASCTRRMVCVDGCTKGDNVLVMWDPRHHQYVLLQDNPVNYFLHADSYAALGLKPPPAQSAVADLLQTSCIGTMSASSAPSPPPSLPSLAAAVAAMAQSSAVVAVTTTADGASAGGGLTPAVAAARLSACLWQDAAMRQTPAAIGKLLDKEFCYARKDANRYRVERGSRFYRAKVGPTSPSRCSDPLGKCCAKRMRQDSDNPVASLTVTFAAPTLAPAAIAAASTAAESASATPRQNSFISSFSQTDSSDLLPDDKVVVAIATTTTKPAKAPKTPKAAKAAAPKTATTTTMTMTTAEAEAAEPTTDTASAMVAMAATEPEQETPAAAATTTGAVTTTSCDTVDASDGGADRTRSPEEADQRVPEQLQLAASDDDDAIEGTAATAAEAAAADNLAEAQQRMVPDDLSAEATLVAEVEAAIEAVAVAEAVAMTEAGADAATVEEANIVVTEEDCGNLSDGSSLYQTFDEVFELDAAKMSAPINSPPRPVSSASSETAPVPDSGN